MAIIGVTMAPVTKRRRVFSLTGALLIFTTWMIGRPVVYFLLGDWSRFSWSSTLFISTLMGITMGFYYGIAGRISKKKSSLNS